MKLYFVNYKDIYEDLYKFEMRHILGFVPEKKYFFSEKEIDLSSSTFFKGVLHLNFTADTLGELENKLKAANLFYDSYKIEYIKIDEDVNYQTRLKAMRDLGYAIEGEFSKDNPSTILRVTKVDGVWYFGLYERNCIEWHQRITKPKHYSIALETRLARVLVSVASSYGEKLVDPCCGIGTVVIEAKKMGKNIDGYDLNRKVVWYSQQNLEHFGLSANIKAMNIADIDQYYDVAIIDLPYGKFVKKDVEMQSVIFENGKRIAKYVIFVAMKDKTDWFKKYGYDVIDSCIVPKANQFKRHIYVTKGCYDD